MKCSWSQTILRNSSFRPDSCWGRREKEDCSLKLPLIQLFNAFQFTKKHTEWISVTTGLRYKWLLISTV